MSIENINSTIKPLWKIKDVAEYLNTSVQAVYKKVSRGTIPYIKCGNGASALRFDPDEIQTFINRNRHKAFAVED